MCERRQEAGVNNPGCWGGRLKSYHHVEYQVLSLKDSVPHPSCPLQPDRDLNHDGRSLSALRPPSCCINGIGIGNGIE